LTRPHLEQFDGRPNPHALHHGKPVKAGSKAIITNWFKAPRHAAAG